MTHLLPPDLLSQLKPRQRAQVKRAEAALARIPQKPNQAVIKELDLLDFIDRYLSEHLRGEKAPFHIEIADMLAAHDRIAIAAPRSHAKSTMITLAHVLHQAAYKKRRFILVIGDNTENADTHLGNVQKELLENEALLTDFPHLRLPEMGDYRKKKVKRRASDFITSGGTRFISRGAGKPLRGLRDGNQRPDLIVVDDLENDASVETPRQRAKLLNWFQKALSNLFGGDNGQLIIVGTILHRESLLSWLLSEAGPTVYAKRLYRAIQDDGTALWPANWSLEKLAVKLDEVKSRAFATEYLNDPAEDDAVLFKPEWIDTRRIQAERGLTPDQVIGLLPPLDRIVVSLDPSTSANGERDACGINVSARAGTEFFVLADLTLNGSPATWSRRALDAYRDWGADEIVAEQNQGGAMVTSTLKAELRDGERLPPVRLVHASRGKQVRAEPVAVEYERGNVRHVGMHGALEIEQSTWVPGMPSPNRLDALVWSLTWLMGIPKKPATPQRYGSVVTNNSRR